MNNLSFLPVFCGIFCGVEDSGENCFAVFVWHFWWFLLQLLGQFCTSAVCPRSFLCAWCQKLHCRGLVVLMTLDGLVMVAPSVRVSARDWRMRRSSAFVQTLSAKRNGCQNLTCRGCPVSCSGSFSTWGSVLQFDATEKAVSGGRASSMLQKRRTHRPAVHSCVCLERVSLLYATYGMLPVSHVTSSISDPELQKNLVTGETWELKAPASLRRVSSTWARV